MKIVIVGAGAVGGYFGGRLAAAGADVTFLVRERRAAQLKEQGLQITSTQGDASITPQLAQSVEEIESCDLLVLAVKNYHLENTLQPLLTLVEKGARILPLLNGVGHLQTLQNVFGPDRVLGGFCNIIVTLNEHGHAVHTSRQHDFSVGALLPEQEAFCARFHSLAKDANLTLIHSPHIYRDMWQKYMFITAFSGLTTASRLSIDGVLEHAPTRFVLEKVLREMCELANRKGAPLPPELPGQMVAGMEGLPAGSTSSMHQDFRKGLPLEVEALQGTAVRMAEEAGLELPTVRTIYGLIKPYEHGHL